MYSTFASGVLNWFGLEEKKDGIPQNFGENDKKKIKDFFKANHKHHTECIIPPSPEYVGGVLNKNNFAIEISHEGNKIAYANFKTVVVRLLFLQNDARNTKSTGGADEVFLLSGHSCTVTCVAFSFDDKYLASADASGRLIVWDLDSTLDNQTKIMGCWLVLNSPACHIYWGEDNNYVSLMGKNRSLFASICLNEEKAEDLKKSKHTKNKRNKNIFYIEAVNGARFSPDENLLATLSCDKKFISILNADNSQIPDKTKLLCGACDRDGEDCYNDADKNNDCRTPNPTGILLADGDASVCIASFSWSEDSAYIAALYENKEVKIYDILTQKVVCTFPIRCCGIPTCPVVPKNIFWTKKDWLIVSLSDGKLMGWEANLKNKKSLQKIEISEKPDAVWNGIKGSACSLSELNGRRTLAVGTSQGGILFISQNEDEIIPCQQVSIASISASVSKIVCSEKSMKGFCLTSDNKTLTQFTIPQGPNEGHVHQLGSEILQEDVCSLIALNAERTVVGVVYTNGRIVAYSNNKKKTNFLRNETTGRHTNFYFWGGREEIIKQTEEEEEEEIDDICVKIKWMKSYPRNTSCTALSNFVCPGLQCIPRAGMNAEEQRRKNCSVGLFAVAHVFYKEKNQEDGSANKKNDDICEGDSNTHPYAPRKILKHPVAIEVFAVHGNGEKEDSLRHVRLLFAPSKNALKEVSLLSVSECGAFVAAYDNITRTVVVWNIETGKVHVTWGGVQCALTCMCFSGDGRYVVSGDILGRVVFWDLISSNTNAYTIRLFNDCISLVHFSSDGCLVVADKEGAMKFVRLELLWVQTKSEVEKVSAYSTVPSADSSFSLFPASSFSSSSFSSSSFPSSSAAFSCTSYSVSSASSLPLPSSSSLSQSSTTVHMCASSAPGEIASSTSYSPSVDRIKNNNIVHMKPSNNRNMPILSNPSSVPGGLHSRNNNDKNTAIKRNGINSLFSSVLFDKLSSKNVTMQKMQSAIIKNVEVLDKAANEGMGCGPPHMHTSYS